MKSRHDDISRLAARALGETHDEDALAVLGSALKDPKAGAPADAVVVGLRVFRSGLGNQESENELRAFVSMLQGDAVDPVVAVFADKSEPIEIRKDAASVMAESRNPKVVGPLVKAMGDKNEQIRYAGLNGISCLCRYATLSQSWFPAGDAAAEKEKWDKSKADLLEALKAQAVPVLMKARESNDRGIASSSKAALESLERVGPPG